MQNMYRNNTHHHFYPDLARNALRVYAQSVSSQIRIKVVVSVIAIHVLHWVTTYLKTTSDPNRVMRAVQNWVYRRKDTVHKFW